MCKDMTTGKKSTLTADAVLVCTGILGEDRQTSLLVVLAYLPACLPACLPAKPPRSHAHFLCVCVSQKPEQAKTGSQNTCRNVR